MPNTIYYKEGDTYEFLIKKEILLDNNESFYVLEDKNGNKQLLKNKHYKHYNLKTGQKIICKIDHINCAGKYFLEPKNPYYDEFKKYKFKIKEIQLVKNRLEENILKITLSGKNKTTAICKTTSKNNLTIGSEIKCKIELIKKGILYVTYIEDITDDYLNVGEYYNFKVKDIKILKDGFKYYILEDKKKHTHILRHEYYDIHNIKIGKNIECLVIKFSSENYFVLEPKHPYYKIGNIYNFNLIKQNKTSDHTDNYEITVNDYYNKEIIFVSNKNLVKNEKQNKITCRVIGIKKGKALLSYIENTKQNA